MELTRLTLTDRDKIEQALCQSTAINQSPLATLAFSPHFIWQNQFAYSWATIRGWVVLFAEYSDGFYMPLPPLGPVSNKNPNERSVSFEEILKAVFELMDQKNNRTAVSRIENIPEELKPEFEKLGCQVKEKDPDYVYRAEDLVALKGDRFKSQRAAYNQLVRSHEVAYQPYQSSDRDACLELFDRWARQKHQTSPVDDHNEDQWLSNEMLADARAAHQEVLCHHHALALTGRVVKKGREVCAYTFGYTRTTHVWCVLLEVTDRHMPGLPQYIFREFCREFASYEFINTMDDSRLPGLAHSKQNYHPCKLVPNYIATRE